MKFGKYHKARTIHIGCDYGEAELNSSFLVTITKPENEAYSIMCWDLSKAFFHAQMMRNEIISDKPFKVSVLCDVKWLSKHKPTDPETGVDRLEWFIRNMLPSDTPMIFTIYVTNRENYWVPSEKWWLWPLQYQWDANNVGDYVTVQVPEMHTSYIGNAQRLPKYQQQLKLFEETCPWEIKYLGYSDPVDYSYQLLKHTRYHFTYLGGTYYLGTMMKIPSIIIGYDKNTINVRDHDQNNFFWRFDLLHCWNQHQVVQLRDTVKKGIKVAQVDNHRVINNPEHQLQLMEEFDALTN